MEVDNNEDDGRLLLHLDSFFFHRPPVVVVTRFLGISQSHSLVRARTPSFSSAHQQ
jgi:hypothetical protein